MLLCSPYNYSGLRCMYSEMGICIDMRLVHEFLNIEGLLQSVSVLKYMHTVVLAI